MLRHHVCIKGSHRNPIPPRTHQPPPNQPTMCCTQQHFTNSPCLHNQLMPLSHSPSWEMQIHSKIQISDKFGASQTLLKQQRGVCAMHGEAGGLFASSSSSPSPPSRSHAFDVTVHFPATREWGEQKRTQQSIENPVTVQMDTQTARDRQTALLTRAAPPRIGFSLWMRGSNNPRNRHQHRPGCSETPRTLGRRSYEAGGGAAPGIPPFHL